MKTNLALGKDVEITELAPISYSYKKCQNQSDFPQWIKLCGGMGRVFTLDLGELYGVSSIQAVFLHNGEQNIICPENIKIALSENGVDYYEIGVVEAPYSPTFSLEAKAVYSLDFQKTYRARYVKIRFSVENHIYFGGIKVFGKEISGNEDDLNGKTVCYEEVDKYLNFDSFEGIKNLAVVPFGFSPEGERIRITKNSFAALLGYFDGERFSDKLFDGIVLDIKPFAPSNGTFFHSGKPSNLSDWEMLIDELFIDNYNLDALNDSVKLMKKAGIYPEQYKLKVFLTAPVPKVSLEFFGNISGDGIQEKLLNTDDCVTAFCWFIDTIKRRFDIVGFDNIEIIGWNWNSGYLGRQYNSENPILAKRCVAELKKRNLKSIIIPFFQLGGSEKAKELGFDLVAMPPLDLYSGIDVDDYEKMIDNDYIKTLEKYGFSPAVYVYNCVSEIKEAEKSLCDFLRFYRKNNLGNGINTVIFQSSDILENVMNREVYPTLYKYLKNMKLKESVMENNGSLPPNKAVKTAKKIKRKPKIKQDNKMNKYALCTAFTAATLGLAYIIKKLKDD